MQIIRLKIKHLIAVFILFIFSNTWAQGETDELLTCFSLSSAEKILRADAADKPIVLYLGGITRAKAIVVDEGRDIIFVGVRDPLVPALSLDDLVIALRSIQSLGEKNCPGVSIEPDPDYKGGLKYREIVRYFGGIENTHFGLVCYKADYLLKELAFGTKPTLLEGVPNEWEIEKDIVKSGHEKFLKRGNRKRWFFPSMFKLSAHHGCAVLHKCKMTVITDYLPRRQESARKLLRSGSIPIKQPYRIFTSALSQNYDEIAESHPVLLELRNLMGISALFKAAHELPGWPGMDYWLNDYEVRLVETPTKVPVTRRGESGLAYGLAWEGGVILSPLIYRARAGDPAGLHDVAIRSRPSLHALTWTIPLNGTYDGISPIQENDSREYELSACAKALMGLGKYDMADQLMTSAILEKPALDFYIVRAEARAKLGQTDRALRDLRHVLTEVPDYAHALKLQNSIRKGEYSQKDKEQSEKQGTEYFKTPGWKPSISGRNLIKFEGRIMSSTTSEGLLDLPKGYAIPPAENAFPIFDLPLTASLIFSNRLEFEVNIPLHIRMGTVARDRYMLGYYMGRVKEPFIIGGVRNINGSVRALLLNGLWYRPYLEVSTSIISPYYLELFKFGDNEPEIGQDSLRIISNIYPKIPLSRSFSIIGSVSHIRTYEEHISYDKWYNVKSKETLANDDISLGIGFEFSSFLENMALRDTTGFLYERSRQLGTNKRVSRILLLGNLESPICSYPSYTGIGWYYEEGKRTLVAC